MSGPPSSRPAARPPHAGDDPAPREAFFLLGRFAVAEVRRRPGSIHGVAARLDEFLERETATPGGAFLRKAISYGARLGFDLDDWIFELVSAVLGDVPPQRTRMLTHCESVMHAFFTQCLGAVLPHNGRFEIAATAGNGASWGVAAQTMIVNRLLLAGDRVAVGGGRLPAGLQVPDLAVYGLRTVHIPIDAGHMDAAHEAEIDKLTDPAVKAFFLVSPIGGSRDAYMGRLASIVRAERPDLLVLADESLATFTEGFRPFAAALPGSVLSTYSFSAHFGAAGWQLGIVALHSANAYDLALAELPHRVRRRLARRYEEVGFDWTPTAFIDRIAAESGCPAVRGVGGLASPQQALAALFALFILVADRPGLPAEPEPPPPGTVADHAGRGA